MQMPERLEPIKPPPVPVVEETETYEGPLNWSGPWLASEMARVSGVEILSMRTKKKWRGARERMRLRVRGKADAVGQYWIELEGVIGVERVPRLSIWRILWDLLWDFG